MAFTRLHHVAIVTSDLEIGRKAWCDGFGLYVNEHRTPLPNGKQLNGVSVLEIPIGEMFIQVVKPDDPNSGAGKFLEESGGRGGMYFIAIASDDIKTDVKGLTDRGAKLEGEWNDSGGVFLDPSTTYGIRIEITPEDNYFAHPFYKGDGVVTGMAHIGLAAAKMDYMRNLWGTMFGLGEDKIAERGAEPAQSERPARAADDPVHLVEFPIGGSVIEISVPTTEDSGTARLVASRAALGATFHHICPFAPDVHKLIANATANGVQQIGSVDPNNPRVVAWFHPRTCQSTLVEAWNRPPGGEHTDHQHGVTPFPY